MQVNGTVMEVAIGATIQKNGGGTYVGTRLTYRDSEGSLKEQAFHNNVLKFNPDIKKALESLNKDDVFTMTKEKEGEFWNVKAITVGVVSDAVSNKSTGTASSGSTKAAASTTPRSTYETSEERAAKQVCIVRQSTITQALTYLNMYKDAQDGPFGVKQVIDVAKQFEAHVLGTVYDDGTIENMQSDIL